MLRRRRSPFVVRYLGAQLYMAAPEAPADAAAAGGPGTGPGGGGAGATTGFLRIFMEHLPGGTLEDLLHESGALPVAAIASYCRQITRGVASLHGRGVVHGDVGVANALVSSTGAVRVTALSVMARLAGLARRPLAAAMEADVWAIGAAALEMATGSAAYRVDVAAAGRLALPASLAPEIRACVDAARGAHARRPPRAHELLEHAFLSRASQQAQPELYVPHVATDPAVAADAAPARGLAHSVSLRGSAALGVGASSGARGVGVAAAAAPSAAAASVSVPSGPVASTRSEMTGRLRWLAKRQSSRGASFHASDDSSEVCGAESRRTVSRKALVCEN